MQQGHLRPVRDGREIGEIDEQTARRQPGQAQLFPSLRGGLVILDHLNRAERRTIGTALGHDQRAGRIIGLRRDGEEIVHFGDQARGDTVDAV